MFMDCKCVILIICFSVLYPHLQKHKNAKSRKHEKTLQACEIFFYFTSRTILPLPDILIGSSCFKRGEGGRVYNSIYHYPPNVELQLRITITNYELRITITNYRLLNTRYLSLLSKGNTTYIKWDTYSQTDNQSPTLSNWVF